jgi:hypothetical protein
MIKQTGGWNFSEVQTIGAGEFVQGNSYMCLGGPMLLSFPLANKKTETRPYFGVLEYLPTPQHKQSEYDQNSLLQENQMKARSFSPYRLHTSERYYLWGVLAAEYPRGQVEVLKALSVIARQNLHFYKSTGETICDNTYCQVFGPRQDLPKILSSKLMSAVEDSLLVDLRFPEGKRWLYFSLGGTNPWKKELSKDVLEKTFKVTGLYDIDMKDHQVYVSSKNTVSTYPCEIFRNQTKLYSCPDKIVELKEKWLFEGKGEGHGMGLDLINASTMASQGKDKKQILNRFFPDGQVKEFKR